MVSEHRLDTFTGISIAMIISGQQDNKERRKPIFCIRWIAKRMQACYNRRRTMNRPPFVLWTMRCSSYRSARKQNHRAPLSTDETLSPGETGAWVDPIARLSCSVFIARRAFDPASVCYAPRVAHGDRAAYLSARGDATLLVLSSEEPETCDCFVTWQVSSAKNSTEITREYISRYEPQRENVIRPIKIENLIAPREMTLEMLIKRKYADIGNWNIPYKKRKI